MASTAKDRLAVFYENYQTAFTHRAADLKAATSAVEVQRIMTNVDELEAAYLDAARRALDATGPDIEAAYQERSPPPNRSQKPISRARPSPSASRR